MKIVMTVAIGMWPEWGLQPKRPKRRKRPKSRRARARRCQSFCFSWTSSINIINQILANPKRTASRAFSIKQDDNRKDCAGREFLTFLSYVYRFDQICRLDLTFRIFRVVILRWSSWCRLHRPRRRRATQVDRRGLRGPWRASDLP